MIKFTCKLILVFFVTAFLCEGNLLAFKLLPSNWSHQGNPMESNWIICADSMPADAPARIKDGASVWDYSRFTFSFGTDSCGSGGVYPSPNNLNQIDFGSGLGTDVLAENTRWFFTNAPDKTTECDMRFSTGFTWNTASSAPSSAQMDWQSVAAHEMGHCLGLDHEDGLPTIDPVMTSSVAPGVTKRNPTTDDIAGRDAIYGASGTGATTTSTTTTISTTSTIPTTTTTTFASTTTSTIPTTTTIASTTTTIAPVTTTIPVATTTSTTKPTTSTTTSTTSTTMPATSTTTITSTTSTTIPTTPKSFTFNCEHELKRGFLLGLEKLTMNIGDVEHCTLKLTNHELGKEVNVSTMLRKLFGSAIEIEPLESITDQDGELEITITAIEEGINWAAWAVPNDRGQFKFNKKTYDTGLAWGMFVKVE